MLSLFNRKYEVLEHFESIHTQLKEKISVSASIGDMVVNWEMPEQFITLSKSYCIGEIEWRRYRSYPNLGIMSSDNHWQSNAEIIKHRHSNSDETIQSVHNIGFISLYDSNGVFEKEIILEEGCSFTIPANKIHSVRSGNKQWDMIVKFQNVK
jgi:hypothetical protein